MKDSCLNTLSAGTHTVEILWTDGSASTAFTINANTSDRKADNGTTTADHTLRQYVGKTFTIGKKLTYKVTACSNKVKTVTVTGSKKQLKSMTIPATVTYKKMKFNVTEISKNAFKNQKKLTKVTIGKNVTKIGANAFYGDKKLAKVTIKSKNLKTINKNAFKNIKKSAVFSVPKGKSKAYKRLLKKSKDI